MKLWTFCGLALLCLASSCKTPTNQPSQKDDVEWSGPGWYWGVYIDNENDFRDHYQNRGSNQEGQSFEGGDRGGHGSGGHR